MEKIRELYIALDEYDKKPLVYKSVIRKPARGRYCARKREGHVGIVTMKRCFLSGASPALSPSKSRIVEALCIHLSNDITSAKTTTKDGNRSFDSRWKLIVKEYNSIRARLFNSALLENTDLTLYNINETTLRLWFKDQVRRQEILTLLQGKNTPGSRAVASERLPPPTKPVDLHGNTASVSFNEPQDRSGMAKLKFLKAKKDSLSSRNKELEDEIDLDDIGDAFNEDFITESIEIQLKAPVSTVSTVSTDTVSSASSITTSSGSGLTKRKYKKKTKYTNSSVPFTRIEPSVRPSLSMFLSPGQPNVFQLPYVPPQLTPSIRFPFQPFPVVPNMLPTFNPYPRPETFSQSSSKEKTPRKCYTCRKCGKPMTEGRGQYKGERYCCNEPGAPPYRQWLDEHRRADKEKKNKK